MPRHDPLTRFEINLAPRHFDQCLHS
jgi:hypothetical protein